MTDQRSAMERPSFYAGATSGAVIGSDFLRWLGAQLPDWGIDPMPETVTVFLGGVLGWAVGRWLEAWGAPAPMFPQSKSGPERSEPPSQPTSGAT